MAAYNKFQGFVGYLGTGVLDLNSDTIKVYLSNATPSASADDVKADLAEITAENGYTAGGEDTTNTYAEVAGVGTITVVDPTVTAAGGTVVPFQWVVAYDATHASDILIGWWARASALLLQDGESFTVAFAGSTLATIQ